MWIAKTKQKLDCTTVTQGINKGLSG